MLLPDKVIKRFWSKVDVKDESSCWPWLGGKSWQYGKFTINGASFVAHRISYIINKGDIPKGLLVRHACDNPVCVNPTHLLTGTNSDNMKDRTERNRLDQKGEKGPRAKLNWNDVNKIRMYHHYKIMSNCAMGRIFNLSRTAIDKVTNNRSWVV